MRRDENRVKALKAKRLTYFSGKPCKYGHNSDRYTSTRICCQCSREYRKAYYERTAK